MEQERANPTTFGIWARSLELMKEESGSFIQIGLKCIFLPYILMILMLAWQSDGVSEGLKGGVVQDYTQILGPAYPYLFFATAVSFIFIMLVISGFFALIHLSVSRFREEKSEARESLKAGLSLAFPAGFWLLLALIVISLEQIFLGPFKIITMFALMSGVIMIVDRKSFVLALKQALTFKYCSPVRGGGLGTALVLVGLSALVFSLEYLLNLLYRFLLLGDEYLGLARGLWSAGVPGLPCSAMYLFANLIYGLGITALIAMIASFLVCLYYTVRAKITHLV